MRIPSVGGASSLRGAPTRGNRQDADVRDWPYFVATAPHPCRRARRLRVQSGHAPEETAMKTERADANAELARSFEPLRIVFALGALLLGLIASLRF
jgi:hypothetical protein